MKRNSLVELFRFIFSILVVGYHVQMSYFNDSIDTFENGALAVEFFFLLTGFFLAKSIEKFAFRSETSLLKETGKFMWNKIKSILPVHFVATIILIVIILVFDINNFGSKLLGGLPGFFLIQQAIFWTEGYNMSLIVPEWYLSAMLISLVIIFPTAIILRKKMRGEFVILAEFAIFAVLAVALGGIIKFRFTTTFIYDLRAYAEILVGMLIYYFTAFLSQKELKKNMTVLLKVFEPICYLIPIIFGIIPISSAFSPATMVIAVVCSFLGLGITFSGKGISIKNIKINEIFAFLGSISLTIYLFHPVIIELYEYLNLSPSIHIKGLFVFFISIGTAVFYRLASMVGKKTIKNRKAKKCT